MADDFDLSSLISPMRAAGLDSNDPRALALFAKMQGGGVGVPGAPDAAAPPVAPAASAQPVGVPPNGRDYEKPAPPGRLDIQPTQYGPGGVKLPSPIPKPVVPGTVTPSGESQGTADDLAAQARSEAALQEAQAKRAQNLNDPATGKLLPDYRPSIGQRIVRGLEGAGLGLAEHGIRGAIGGAINPAMTGAQAYGAPNKAGQQELRREDSDIAMGQQSLAEQARRFKERQEAARADRLEAQANQPPKQTPEKSERVVDAAGHVHYVTPSQIEQSGQYFDPSTYNKENGPDRVPTTYDQVVIAEQNEKDPNGPLHKAAQEMRDTEKKKFQAANPGRQPTDAELWSQAFQSEYGRKPNAEEIASRHVAGGGLAGEAAGKPGKAADRTAFDTKWNGQFNTMEKKYDARKKAILAQGLDKGEEKAQLDANEADRSSEKLNIQNEKDKAAEQSGVYSGQPAAPTGNTPRQTPQNNQPKIPTKADIPSASEGRRNPKTGEEAYKINGKWYKASELK